MERDVKQIEHDIFLELKAGAKESEAGMNESPYNNGEWHLNDLQRELMAATKRIHGDAWLGHINLYHCRCEHGDP